MNSVSLTEILQNDQVVESTEKSAQLLTLVENLMKRSPDDRVVQIGGNGYCETNHLDELIEELKLFLIHRDLEGLNLTFVFTVQSELEDNPYQVWIRNGETAFTVPTLIQSKTPLDPFAAQFQAPLQSTPYFVPDFIYGCKQLVWEGSELDFMLLEKGLVYLKAAHASQHAETAIKMYRPSVGFSEQ